MYVFASGCWKWGFVSCSTLCTPGHFQVKRQCILTGRRFERTCLRKVLFGCYPSLTGNSEKWKIMWEKYSRRMKKPLDSSCFFEHGRVASCVVSTKSVAGSVSERRFPANHSTRVKLRSASMSVSERRFPANHSWRAVLVSWIASVSERRFPANHSFRDGPKYRLPVYPSDDSPQTTATSVGWDHFLQVYPSDDSPQTTANVLRGSQRT